MPRICLTWTICSLGLASCGTAIADQAGTTIVENSQVRLVFATGPVPFLRQLVQKPSEKNLLAEPADENLFAVTVLPDEESSITVESRTAKEGSITVERRASVQHLLIQFSGLGPSGDLRVILSGELDDAESWVRWSIALENPSGQRLSAIRFPLVTAVRAIGQPDDDFIIAPASPGAIIENPAKNWPETYAARWRFPGEQSVQFCSYQDCTTGVYLSSMDPVGHPRALSVSKGGHGYRLVQDYRLQETTASQWRSPYEVAFGVTSGTWQQTADIYKRWAIQQPWCATTLVQRDDIPDFWKDGPCIHTVEVRTYDRQTRLCNGSYYPQLPEHMKRFRAKIDGPVLPMLPGWENHRRWTAGEYFPVFDAERAKDVLTQLREGGFPPFLYLSGLFYTFRNEGRDGGELASWERYCDAFVIDPASGKPRTYVLDESSPSEGSVWRRHSYQFCPAAPGVKEFFQSVIDQTHALGVDILQMDQAALGYWTDDPCGSTSHGHEPGSGLYQVQAFRDLLDDMRRHGKSLNPVFLLTVEELNEGAIPHVDGFHTREYREHFWYHAAPGARSLPLFSYLYHEYALVYGGEGPGLSKAKNDATVRDMAVNLVTGKTPAASVWSGQSAMAEAHPDQFRMLRNHSHLLKTEAQRFLMLGRMLHQLEFEVPSITLQKWARREGEWRSVPFVEHAVLSSSWQSPEGNVGHCLVNITGDQQLLHVPLDTRSAPSWRKADVDLYRAETPETCECVWRDVRLPRAYELDLAPLEAVFFVIKPARMTGDARQIDRSLASCVGDRNAED